MNKLNIIIAAVALLFAIINQVGQGLANKRARKEREKREALEQRFTLAKNITAMNETAIKSLVGKVSMSQAIIDQLRQEQSELRAEIKAGDKRLANIKTLLKTKTTFSDSSKTAILNNLPK
jgi:peptidoglycan hydrolase CwlO-like protein